LQKLNDMIRILITDDHPIVRQGIRQILEDDEKIILIDEASNGKELLEKMMNQEYEVILLDISLPGRSGLDMISQIRKIQHNAAILILSIHSEELYALKALKYGASGYITKSSATGELLAAIHKVANGKKYISATLAEQLAEQMLEDSIEQIGHNLSPREMQVLDLFAAGKTVNQIAQELSLSSKTISTYRTRLLSKLNLKTTADLIRYSIVEGMKDKTINSNDGNQ
jgi:two-component system, NarL family, invasion response regulator UvrY